MEILKCPKERRDWWGNSICGQDRDCLPDFSPDSHQTFREHICYALAWNAKHPTRRYEIFDPTGKKRLANITQGWGTAARLERCGLSGAIKPAVGAYAAGDAFTVDVPGIQDILKVKDWESKQLRYERYQRFATAKSAVPKALQWIPPLLTKLDNAQDLLFTGLALAIPIIRRLAPRFIPGVGLLLTLNDILNLFT